MGYYGSYEALQAATNYFLPQTYYGNNKHTINIAEHSTIVCLTHYHTNGSPTPKKWLGWNHSLFRTQSYYDLRENNMVEKKLISPKTYSNVRTIIPDIRIGEHQISRGKLHFWLQICADNWKWLYSIYLSSKGRRIVPMLSQPIERLNWVKCRFINYSKILIVNANM